MKKVSISVLVLLFFFGGVYAQEKIDIKVDATKTGDKIEPFWASQIVHPTEFITTNWGKDLLKLMSETGAAKRYIRIYNQPERAIRIDETGQISYDWQHFDEMVKLILQSGNKPEIAFFGMPKELARYSEPVRKRPYGAEVSTSPPRDYGEWEDLCIDFAQHILSVYGEEEVTGWTVRCWNEPDGNFLYKGDLVEYCKMYDYFALAFRKVNPNIRIGGPALTSSGTWREPERFKYFLDHIVNGKNYATGEKGSPIDFISIHTYGGTGGGAGTGRKSPEVNYMMELQFRLADMKDEYPSLKNLPIFVEEWGETASGVRGVDDVPSADIRNSEYSAAFLVNWVGRHIKIKQTNDRGFENFTFCASGYEKIPERDFMGYRTLDTKNGFHKPILNAYKLLDKLAGSMVEVKMESERDDVISFATADNDRVLIVVVNYQAEDIFNEGEGYRINLDIELPWGSSTNLKMNHWRIDRGHSNAYSAFKELGSPELPNPIEIDYIKSKMELEKIAFEENIMRNMRQMEFTLPSNGVSLIEIQKMN